MRRAAFALLMATLAVVGPARAEPEGGVEILERARERSQTEWSWKDRRQVLTLRIQDGRGNERVRKLAMLTRRYEDGEKSLAVFLEPAEVRGSGFLQHTADTGPSSQWLYLPDLGRVRQVNSKARRKSFFGTDFSYADLDVMENALQWEEDDAATRRLAREPAGEGEKRVWFELRPRAEDPPYPKVTMLLSEDTALLRSIEMYEADGPPTKVLVLGDTREVDGVPTAHRLDMSRPSRGTRTIVEVSELRYDTGVGDDAFTKRALERGLDHVE